MATASGSSASHRVRERLRPDLPLIACGKCKQKTMLEYRVKKEDPNHGRIFYKCPDRNWDGTRCEGWYWEEEYVKHVQESAEAADESAPVHEEVNQQKKLID